MNENKTYQLIAEKLNALPVPDLADLIWAKIEAQLDIDLPPDTGNDDPGPAPAPKPVGKKIALGAATIAIAISFFQLLNNRNENVKTTPLIRELQQTKTNNAGSGVAISKPPSEKTGNHPLQPGIQVTTENKKTDSSLSPFPVSIVSDKIPETIADTLPLVIPPVVLQPAGDTVAVKRRRGVPLNESDYRIVPKKDS